MSEPTPWSGQKPPSRFRVGLQVGVLLLPALVLLAGTLQALLGGLQPHLVLWLGTACQILVCCFVVSRREWRKPSLPLILLLYLTALAWLWLGAPDLGGWY